MQFYPSLSLWGVSHRGFFSNVRIIAHLIPIKDSIPSLVTCVFDSANIRSLLTTITYILSMLGKHSGSPPLAVFLHELSDGEAVNDPLEVSSIERWQA